MSVKLLSAALIVLATNGFAGQHMTNIFLGSTTGIVWMTGYTLVTRTNYSTSVIVGGSDSTTRGDYSVVGGGGNSIATKSYRAQEAKRWMVRPKPREPRKELFERGATYRFGRDPRRYWTYHGEGCWSSTTPPDGGR